MTVARTPTDFAHMLATYGELAVKVGLNLRAGQRLLVIGPLAGEPRQFATARSLSPGAQGVSLSILRPSGKARFADHVVDVVTQGEYVAPNTPLTVVESDGMRVVVKATS